MRMCQVRSITLKPDGSDDYDRDHNHHSCDSDSYNDDQSGNDGNHDCNDHEMIVMTEIVMIVTLILFQTLYYPEHVGFPLGTDDSPRYVLMETHYDNPRLRAGLSISFNQLMLIMFHKTFKQQIKQYYGCHKNITSLLVQEFFFV